MNEEEIKAIQNEEKYKVMFEYASSLKGPQKRDRFVKLDNPSLITYLNEIYKQEVPFAEKLYMFTHNMYEIPRCLNCGGPVKFVDGDGGYHKYCCSKCANSDKHKIEVTKKIKLERYGSSGYNNMKKGLQTRMEKYGSGNNFEKVKQTKLERYGDAFYNNFEKVKQTKLERYGDMYFTNLKKGWKTKLERYGDMYFFNPEKAQQTCLVRYGVKHFTNPKKAQQTKLERYGNAFYNNPVKALQTCLARYGVKNYTQTEEYKQYVSKIRKISLEKSKQTCLARYGVEHYVQSNQYKNLLPAIIKRMKLTKLERYGNESYNNFEKIKQTKLERYGDAFYNNFEKIKQTKLERYGDENYTNIGQTLQTKLVKYGNSTFNNYEKTKQTCLEKYGVDNVFKDENIKQKLKEICLEKYGVIHYSKTDRFKKQVYDTMKKNHTFGVSSIENELKTWLNEHHIKYEYQYMSDNYPYKCDFYFPEKDLYLEIQGSWVHGFHPFDPKSEIDINTLSKWKAKNTDFYNIAIEVWTIRDPEKRKWAYDHNLNWKEVFSCDLTDILKELDYYSKDE